MSNGAVDLKIRVLVIRGAVCLKVVVLVLFSARAIGLMSNNCRVRDSITALDIVRRIRVCGEMSTGICRLVSNEAVVLKIRVLVNCRAVGLKVIGLVITAKAVVLISNTVRGIMIACYLDVLVFRGVLGCSVVRHYREFFSGVVDWLGLAVGGDFLRLEKRLVFGA